MYILYLYFNSNKIIDNWNIIGWACVRREWCVCVCVCVCVSLNMSDKDCLFSYYYFSYS